MCTLKVQYSPTEVGTPLGEIIIPSDDVYYPAVKLGTSGTAEAFSGYFLPDTGVEATPVNPMRFATNSPAIVTDMNT